MNNMGRGYAILSWLNGHHIRPTRGCEVGVRFGRLSAFLLERLPTLHLTMVDPWAEVAQDHPARLSAQAWALQTQSDLDQVCRRAMAGTDFAKDRRCVIRRPSPEAAADVEDGSLDFAFVDGDHLYEPCLADLVAWWPKIKPGGCLCGDDWENPLGMGQPNEWGVGQAVRKFCEMNGLAYVLAEPNGDSQTWYIGKPG